ncbi:hypothetical protein BVC80_8979g28 [Macleaya cordata]|uniref:Ataxin-2 n=1 Tax=Macleaya cordata TaxID=56857 RepID=A0A200QME7_MACCD|nr:hypothetical protein BVC80_8979g28 [Macleaya cordata]
MGSLAFESLRVPLQIALENKTDQKEMALVSERKSTLNPDAPLFIPESFRHVEDFSPEWWDLVKTSTWFRDYWLNLNQEEEGYFFDENDKNEIADLLPESFELGISEEDEFPNLEAELEEMVRSSEAGDYKIESALENKKPSQNGLEIEEAQALMKNLGLYQSPKGSPKSPVEPVKYREKPTQYGSPKCSSSSPRFIHQPR